MPETPFYRRLQNEFLVSVQIDPPKIVAPTELFEDIQKLIKAGVDLIDINSSKRQSYDSIQLACKLKEPGLEVIPHVTTRESSINGLINQITAAHYLNGVENFLIITGDPHENLLNLKYAKGVFQTDSIGALSMFSKVFKESNFPNLIFAAAINQNAANIIKEGDRVRQKEDAGADFFMSQPVFNGEQSDKASDFHLNYTGKPLMIGVWPLISRKTIEDIYLNRITGVKLPKSLYFESLKYDENSLMGWGFEKAAYLIENIKTSKNAQGVYLVAPGRKPSRLIELLKMV